MRKAVIKRKVVAHLAYRTFLRRVFSIHFDLCPFCLNRKVEIVEVQLVNFGIM